MDHARILARFTYRDCTFPLRIAVGERRPSFFIVCPVCGKNCRISEAHRLVVNVTEGTFTVTPSLICPNRECGWRVEIRKGVASDFAEMEVEAPPSSAWMMRSSHPERDRVCACGRQFRSKTYKECKECRGEVKRLQQAHQRFRLSRA